MKNFRKTIIALATVAAMLVPSAAMAATLTTTVDKDITGDVYVGFYDGAILKDVVKTTVDAITVDDATPAGTEDELPATVVITDEETDAVHVDGSYSPDGAKVRKLVFTATADASIGALNLTLSYDKNDVVLVSVPMQTFNSSLDLTPDVLVSYEAGKMVPYTYCSYEAPNPVPVLPPTTAYFTAAESKVKEIGDRVGLCFSQSGGGTGLSSLTNGRVIFELYYRVLDGATVDADTFRVEKDLGPGTIHTELAADPGKENGIKLSNEAGGYTYGSWQNGVATPDTIKLVTPWDVQESTTKDLTVTVPAGAEGYTPTMFIWDADQIAQCAPITTFTKN